MTTVWLDLETRCALSVKEVGSYRYCEHESFRILMAGYAIDDGPVRVAVGEMELFSQIYPLLSYPNCLYVAWNVGFDRIALSRYDGLTTGSYLDPAQWVDPSAMAINAGYPAGLDKAAKALGVPPKDSAGTRLINLFSKPNRKGGWNDATTHPEQWQEFIAYCGNDVEAMRATAKLLPKQLPQERAVWIADQRINDAGLKIDLPMAQAAVAADAVNKAEARSEVIEITGVGNPGSGQQMLSWFASVGLPLPNLTKETVEAALDRKDLPPYIRRVLELRQELALASAPAKFKRAVAYVNDDGRVRGQFRYNGAHTGRWTGRGIQLQNLPRRGLGNKLAPAMLDLMHGFGAHPETLKGLVRPLILGPLTMVDYGQIESRVTAWLAREQWALDAFRTGDDIYVATAKQMSSPTQTLTRQHGKVATLALGFGGGVGALRKMGGDALGDDMYLQSLVDLWRKRSARVVDYWNDLWGSFVYGGDSGRITVEKPDRRTRVMVLPSGRSIVYRDVRRIKAADGKWKWTKRDPTGQLVFLWRGIIMENAVQAIARDLMAYCLPELLDLGVPVIGHVHDEILAEGDHLDLMTKVMTANPDWADGLPLAVEGHVVDRYQK